MNGRASIDTSPRSTALVRVTLCLQRAPYALASGLLYLLAQIMYHLNGRRPGALFLSTLEPPLAAAGSSGPLLCLVLED